MSAAGAMNCGSIIRSLPQNFALLNSETSVAAAINPGRNSTWDRCSHRSLERPRRDARSVHGHRLAPGGYDGAFVDISLYLAPRCSVLTTNDGASAIYRIGCSGPVS